MQKKLLLLVIVVYGVILQADEQNYSEYREKQCDTYQKALVSALAGNESAIDDEDQKNKQANDDEEKESRRKQYDGNPGYWGTEPSINSEIGRKYHQYAQYKQAKNKIDQDISQETKQTKDIFNKEVLPLFAYHLEANHFMVDKFSAALRDCGTDLNCYDEKGLSPTIFTDADFGLKYERRLYISGAKIAAENKIMLTPEEMKIIAAGNPATKEFLKGIQDKVNKISEQRREIVAS